MSTVLDWSEQLLRTLLFVPGDQPRKLAKAASFGADAIILDLEDAVALNRKDEARDLVRQAIPTYRNTVVMVRVNALTTGRCADDLAAVVGPGLAAVVLPKVEEPHALREVDDHLTVLEREAGLPARAVRVVPLIETARGVAQVELIAMRAPDRVLTLGFGPGDLTTDLGIDLTADATELLYARSRLVIAARAGGLTPPIDGVYLLDLTDTAGLIEDTRRGRQLGYQGRTVIYPPQIAPVNEVYSSVSPDDVARARAIVQGFEASEAAGRGALLIGGRMVDYPIYRRAVQTLRRHAVLRAAKV
jgi:citrate lyase subunit beta/citryl-CoA lyase